MVVTAKVKLADISEVLIETMRVYSQAHVLAYDEVETRLHRRGLRPSTTTNLTAFL